MKGIKLHRSIAANAYSFSLPFNSGQVTNPVARIELTKPREGDRQRLNVLFELNDVSKVYNHHNLLLRVLSPNE